MDIADSIIDHHMRKLRLIIPILAVAIIIAAGVVRAQKGQNLISYEQIDVDNEIRITADDAMEGAGEFRWSKLIVKSGETIVIEPELEEAGIKVCVSHVTGKFYDDTVEGTQVIEVQVDPGTYDIGTLPMDGATGTMSISAR